LGCAFLCGFSPLQFAVAGLCFAKPFYATAKRQLPNGRRASPQSGSPLRGLRLTAGLRHAARYVQVLPTS